MNKEIYINMLEYYRDEYEDFIGVSTFDVSLKAFTLEQQIMRYGKHICFWYMKKDQLDFRNPPNKTDHRTFINLEIKRAMDMIKERLPKKAVEIVLIMIVETRKVQKSMLTQMGQTHF